MLLYLELAYAEWQSSGKMRSRADLSRRGQAGATEGHDSGGIVTSTMMELLVFPAIYFIWRAQSFRRAPLPATAEPVPLGS